MLNLYIGYVIVFKKKEEIGGFIRKIIWQLFNNKEKIIDKKDVLCEFENNIIKYIEDDGVNILDLNNKLYERENKDYKLKIDVVNNTFMFNLKEKNYTLNNKLLSSSLDIKDDIITLKYALNNEEKKIIIQML